MDAPETHDELLDSVKGGRAELLLAINDNHPGETPKSELTGVTKSVDPFLDDLTKWGVIDVVARERRGKGLPMRMFKLTDLGRDVVEDILNDESQYRPIPSAVEQHMADLRRDVDEAQADAREAREEAQEAQERVETLKEWIRENVVMAESYASDGSAK